jgi:hypothetical protein
MKTFGTWLVQGCGVSAICNTPEGVVYWMQQIVEHGGVPTYQTWAETL